MDIDIDLPPSTQVQRLLPNAVRASMLSPDGSELKPHLVGWYLQNVPVDPVTGLCAIPYKDATQFGLFKIDFLSLSVLGEFSNKEKMRKYTRIAPDWNLLQNDDVVAQLLHLSAHGDILKQVKPQSVLQLADVLALIRPGKHLLINSYLKNKKDTRKVLYTKTQGSDLRKSHALGYALMVVLQLHKISGVDFETR